MQGRHREPELMDQPSISPAEHRSALAGLQRLNALSMSVRPLWRALLRFAASPSSPRPLHVLDLACGGGDVPIRLAQLARREGVAMSIHACDVSSTAVVVAREAALSAGIPSLHTFQLDVLRDPLPQGYDVLICSLFLHHLSTEDTIHVLRAMSQAAREGILVHDIIRSPLGYALCWIGTRALSRSRVVRIDGARSVRAAYSRDEIESLIARAGLGGASVQYHWPERALLSWKRVEKA